MKSRSLILKGRMAQAAHTGIKTQTRRPLKPQPSETANQVNWNTTNKALVPWRWADNVGSYGGGERTGGPIHCPYGKVGDQLWVRETWQQCDGDGVPVEVPQDWMKGRETNKLYLEHDPVVINGLCYKADPSLFSEEIKWRPSIHMPRWACRTVLEIQGVEVERLRDITGKNAQAEGWPRHEGMCPLINVDDKALEWFSIIWNNCYGYGAWERNDWVWVIKFKRVEQK